MSALYGSKYVFCHIPKCGGKWVRRTLEAAGLHMDRDLSDGHAPAPGISNADWVSFTFIRHPATWLASWWGYCERSGWAERGRLPDSFDQGKPYDRMIWVTSSIPRKHGFETWVEELETYYPGYVSKFFEPYMRSVQIVGHQETLRRDLQRIVGKVPNLYPVNVGNNVPEVSDDLLAFIAEREPLQKLGYSSTRLTLRTPSVLTSRQKGENGLSLGA